MLRQKWHDNIDTIDYLSIGLERLSWLVEFRIIGIVSAGLGPSLIERYAPSIRKRRCRRHCTYTSGTPLG